MRGMKGQGRKTLHALAGPLQEGAGGCRSAALRVQVQRDDGAAHLHVPDAVHHVQHAPLVLLKPLAAGGRHGTHRGPPAAGERW